ncbi:periplasmic binding protein [Chitinispirillum alkaliphilum]|nr:periplasmic binding protein [Chitinispirillum alkaliphilum]
MKRHHIFTVIIAFSLSFWYCSESDKPVSKSPERIISLAPSITETLFALGLGEKIIGITSYCKYPPQTEQIEKIGGYADANLERIITLRPDVVVMTSEHEKQRVYLERFGINTLVVENHSSAAICSSFSLIGRYCGITDMSDSLVAYFKNKMEWLEIAGNQNPPKILICVGRDNPGAGRIGSIFAAGKSTFYNDLIEAAGGVNAYSLPSPSYPRLSPEGIMSLAPDIIIDIAPSMGDYTCSLLVEDWYSLSRVPAVRKGNVFCLSGDYATIPGPRILLLLDDIREIISDLVVIEER